MQIIYKNDKLKDVCNNLKLAIRKYVIDVARSLHKLIIFMKNAENLKSIAELPQYRLHQSKGIIKREGSKKKGEWQIIK